MFSDILREENAVTISPNTSETTTAIHEEELLLGREGVGILLREIETRCCTTDKLRWFHILHPMREWPQAFEQRREFLFKTVTTSDGDRLCEKVVRGDFGGVGGNYHESRKQLKTHRRRRSEKQHRSREQQWRRGGRRRKQRRKGNDGEEAEKHDEYSVAPNNSPRMKNKATNQISSGYFINHDQNSSKWASNCGRGWSITIGTWPNRHFLKNVNLQIKLKFEFKKIIQLQKLFKMWK